MVSDLDTLFPPAVKIELCHNGAGCGPRLDEGHRDVERRRVVAALYARDDPLRLHHAVARAQEAEAAVAEHPGERVPVQQQVRGKARRLQHPPGRAVHKDLSP